MFAQIIIVNQTSGYLTVDIANALSTSFNKVVIFSSSLYISKQQLNSNVNLFPLVTYKKKSYLTRFFTWFMATIQTYFKILVRPGYELLLTSNPPFVPLLGLFLRRQFSILIYDIYPQALENIGISKSHWIYRFWIFCNRLIYKKAESVITISEGMKDVISEMCDRKKISVIHNWSSIENIKKIPKKENSFILKNDLANKFIVQYSGNIGLTHQVEIIIDIANCLKQEKDIIFVIIGDGMKKQALVEKVEKLNLESVLFLPFLHPSEFHQALSVADISIITLNVKTGLLSVPSKTCNCLAVGSPLLCVTPCCSELKRIIDKYDVGKCFEKDNIKEMVDFILLLKNNPNIKQEYSNRAIEASKNFTKSNAEQYKTILK